MEPSHDPIKEPFEAILKKFCLKWELEKEEEEEEEEKVSVSDPLSAFPPVPDGGGQHVHAAQMDRRSSAQMEAALCCSARLVWNFSTQLGSQLPPVVDTPEVP